MALKDIFHGKETTESQVQPMKIFDNITEIVRDDLQKTIKKNGRVSVAAACFSMYAYSVLKKQLESIDEFRFVFTSPTFIAEKAELSSYIMSKIDSWFSSTSATFDLCFFFSSCVLASSPS